MPPEPLILAFDTSAAHCAAALLLGETVLDQRVEPMSKGQAERLFPLLAEILADAGKDWSDLTALGVGTGPGNFTGIRLSVASARGLALSLGIPAVGVSTFQALSEGLPRPTLVAVDARRGQTYLQVLHNDHAAAPLLWGEGDDLSAYAADALCCVGDHALDFAAALGIKAAEPAMPVATAIARVALDRHRSAQPRPAPLYIRSADAAPAADPPPVILP